MAGKGKAFQFHGSFSSKDSAIEKEREVGGFILQRGNRYYVLTGRKRAKGKKTRNHRRDNGIIHIL